MICCQFFPLFKLFQKYFYIFNFFVNIVYFILNRFLMLKLYKKANIQNTNLRFLNISKLSNHNLSTII